MTFTATPEPDNIPPRVRLDFDAGSGASFTELLVKRNGKAIREQPYAGGSVALAYDYEAPFGVLATYSVSGQILPAASPDWTENWASLAAWSGDTSAWSVSGGKAQTAVTGFTINRSASGTIQRVSVTSAERLILQVLDVSNVAVVTVQIGPSTVSLQADGSQLTSSSTGTYQITMTDGDVTVSATDGSWSLSDTYTGTPRKIRLFHYGGVGLAKVGQIAVTLVTTPTDYAATATATLDVDEAWLIHPSQPSLSCSIAASAWRDNGINVDTATAQDVGSESFAFVHRPVGRSRPVVVTHGSRAADEWSLVLVAPRVVDKTTVRAIVNDQTPLLLRSPASFAWDLPDGWYSVGNVTVSRLSQALTNEFRRLALPLTPVDEPIVRQGALRNWGDVLLEAATWGDLLDMYDTWLDVLAGDVA